MPRHSERRTARFKPRLSLVWVASLVSADLEGEVMTEPVARVVHLIGIRVWLTDVGFWRIGAWLPHLGGHDVLIGS